MTPTAKALTAKLLLLLISVVLLGVTFFTWILARSSTSTLYKRFPELHGRQTDPLYFEIADWVSSHIPPLAVTALLACFVNLAVAIVLVRRHRFEDILEIGGVTGRLVLGGLMSLVFLVLGTSLGMGLVHPLLIVLAGFFLGVMLPTIWQRTRSARNPGQS